MTSASGSRRQLALLVGVVLMVTWGANFAIQKHVFATFSAGGFLFLRYTVLAGCAAALLCHRYGTQWPKLSAADWRVMVGAGLIGQFFHVALITYGIDLSTAFSSSLILACGPIFTLLTLRLLGIEKLRRVQVLGVLIACAGVVFFSSEKLARYDWTASGGDMLLLLGTVLFSLYTVMVKPLIMRHGAIMVVCYATLIGAPPMFLLEGRAMLSIDWGNVPLSAWVGFVWSVVGVSFFGWIIWGWVNATRGVAQSAPLLYLMPPVAGLIAWFTSGEALSLSKLAGAAIALLGVAIAQYSTSR